MLALVLASLASINVNTAPADSLAATLPGVGPKIAERIVQERTTSGPFASCSDLSARVRGIGAKKLDKICPEVAFR